MPTYTYQCKKCEARHDVFHSMSVNPRVKCEVCGAACKRLMGTGAGLIFKGSGFYETDTKTRTGYKEAASAESSSKAESAGKGDSGGKSESPGKGDTAAKGESAGKSERTGKGETSGKTEAKPAPAAKSESKPATAKGKPGGD